MLYAIDVHGVMRKDTLFPIALAELCRAAPSFGVLRSNRGVRDEAVVVREQSTIALRVKQ